MSRDEDSNIPASAKQLAPYLRPRQDALRIRQALTLYLQSHIVPTDGHDDNSDFPASHLALVVPNHASVNVKRIPPEVTGVRKEYLKALQENIAVRREYNDLVDRITSRRAKNQSALNDYLALLRERRRYEKLQVFDIHLKEWTATSEPPTGQSDSTRIDLDGLLREKADGPTDGAGNNVQELISKLEKTVVRAKEKLAREQYLLKQLQDRQATRLADSDVGDNKIRALQRTRDELVQWVEDKLAITGTEDDTNQLQHGECTTSSTETSQLAAAEYKARIRAQYTAYIAARKTLLEAVSALSQPSRSAATNLPAIKPAEAPVTNETEEWGSIDVFRTVSEHILPATKYQKSLALQRSYLAGMLTKERTNFKHTLDRLSQESHLLPEYPLLARHSKFRHITPTSSGLRQEKGGKPRDDVLERAEAWAFAAEAARSNESDYIQQRIEHGAEMADMASEMLQQIYDLLHQERRATTEDKDYTDAHQESDIWTAEVQPRKVRAKRSEQTHQKKGPWSALDGRVGIE
ncbi:conserved hypothetical protein [Talaromyces stipitatus ATCC 10500]|uniref:Uncharacterized protein n=1 Tax=Talaromyces stipitatus (strain ATCC 10500 / CBS 375.48 / QM 6759 / NRRL 1006) TaxID=441959 RepID=B8MHQ2_TALSN|nr:uncharacterized protein TSTA_011430 [Talaromyces stipitatus ATCC 10500]EED16033.1 conserved hypothetical protein [Talaromyces stipitatus ATCC 10500]